MPVEPRLEIRHEGEPIAVMSGADLQALHPRDYRADFHCVTGWSVTGLIWTGVPLREILASVAIVDAPAPYLVARAGDRRKVAFMWEDATADDVILATHLNRASLDDRHGRLCGSYHRASTPARARNISSRSTFAPTRPGSCRKNTSGPACPMRNDTRSCRAGRSGCHTGSRFLVPRTWLSGRYAATAPHILDDIH